MGFLGAGVVFPSGAGSVGLSPVSLSVGPSAAFGGVPCSVVSSVDASDAASGAVVRAVFAVGSGAASVA